jgi:hypothetical protein
MVELKRTTHRLVVAALPLFFSVCVAFCAPTDREVASGDPATRPQESTEFAKDFAHAEDLAAEVARSERLRGYLGLETIIARIEPETRKMSARYGRGAIPFALNQLFAAKHSRRGGKGYSTLVGLTLLDDLGAARDLEEFLGKTLENAGVRDIDVFYLDVSYRSKEMRTAVANAVAYRLATKQVELSVPFLVICGDEHTAGLLLKADPADRSRKLDPGYIDAASRIRWRLALPREQQEQWSHQELLFYQAFWSAPVDIIPRRTYPPVAARLASQNEKFSIDFLRGILENPASHDLEEKKLLALDIIVTQKERDAIPLLIKLENSPPPLSEEARKTLKLLRESLNEK